MNNPAITNLVLSLGAMQVARRLPLEDPEFITYLRIGYVASQLIALAVYWFITLKIRRRNDLTVLKYVNPPSAMNPDAKPELVTTTVKDYDLVETGKAMRGLFMHGYLKYTQPLFIQGIMTLKGVLESNPAKLHLWGKKAEGDLARPFKTAGGFLEGITGKAQGPQTDAASIKAAEKAGAGGKSE
ncbi:Inorganic phosphate transport protein PHO88 [Saitozyma sp. JCM 24511]|nr:Inorganic phosphate transport protein PHO88 [Saitozyma sp. JCM 24511]